MYDLKSFTASTLPRSRFNGHNSFKPSLELDLNSPPKMEAPKSPESPDQENPLRMLRSKNFPVVKPRLKIIAPSNTSQIAHENNAKEEKDSNCESPSYLTGPEYTYNENDVITSNNPPLPPRDRNKKIPANQKRHVRKHPLIIPGTGIQRTLDRLATYGEREERLILDTPKVAKPSDDDKIDLFSMTTDNNNDNDDSVNLDINVLQKSSSDSSKLNEIENHCAQGPSFLAHDKAFAKIFVENNNFPTSKNDPTYENLDIFGFHSQYSNNFNVDTASLDCESILENDMDDEMSPTTSTLIDIVDGFDRKVAEEEEENSSGQASRWVFQALAQASKTDDELKTGDLKRSINYVSCEDLLEFAEKPKGRERGLESDEVRIMNKILGKDVSIFIIYIVHIVN
jgi:hypothetical protein